MFEDGSGPQGRAWVVPGVTVERPVTHSPELLALQLAVEALAGVDVARLSGQDLLSHTRTVLGTAQRLRLLGLAALAQVEERDLHELDGVGSTARWVSSQGLSADRTELAVAGRLAAFPL